MINQATYNYNVSQIIETEHRIIILNHKIIQATLNVQLGISTWQTITNLCQDRDYLQSDLDSMKEDNKGYQA
jgi:hypothetical protein